MGRRVPRTVGWSVVAASLVASLGACSAGSAEPAPLPTVKPSPSASTTQASAPTMPAAARGTDAKAAKAFVRHYISVLNYSSATGDVQRLDSLGAAGCKSCRSVARRINGVYEAGGRLEGRGWIVTAIVSVESRKARSATVDVGVKLSPQRVFKSRGSKPLALRGGRLPLTFHLVWQGSNWAVREWERAA